MKITKEWLIKNNACQEAVEWGKDNGLIGKNSVPVLNALKKADKIDWACWLITRVMVYKQYVRYAIYAAEQIIDIYEREYPDDKRPCQAIEAAKLCLKENSKKNRKVAQFAANSAAYLAAHLAADAVADSAYSAAYAAYAAANSEANSAAYLAAYSAADAAYAAANSEANSAAHAVTNSAKIKKRILGYGLELLSKEKGKR